MRAIYALSFGFLAPLLFAACTGPAGEACGLEGGLPTTDEVGSGQLLALKDGADFDVTGSWKRPPGGSLTGGSLDIIIEHDGEGAETADLIDNETFPICVPIGARAEDSGQANYVDGGFVSDDSHGGMLAILGTEGGEILGRFSFSLANPAGTEMSFESGIFRVPERQ